ncbi:MAG TPA: zinc ribbon domain-containing protein [Smithella sp.]|nr:zinc ribbon domain-containing protein [Smithella sp.]
MADFPDDSEFKRKVAPADDASEEKIPQGEYEIKDAGDIIPLDQWSRVDELYGKNNSVAPGEVKPGDEPVIPVEQWSNLQEKNKEEKSAGVKKSVQEGIFVAPITDKSDAEAMKACPSCGARIRKDAVKCRYCGEIVQQSARRKILL